MDCGPLFVGLQAEISLAGKCLRESEAVVAVARLLRRSTDTLQTLDLRIEKLDNAPRFHADHVVMVLATHEFVILDPCDGRTPIVVRTIDLDSVRIFNDR